MSLLKWALLIIGAIVAYYIITRYFAITATVSAEPLPDDSDYAGGNGTGIELPASGPPSPMLTPVGNDLVGLMPIGAKVQGSRPAIFGTPRVRVAPHKPVINTAKHHPGAGPRGRTTPSKGGYAGARKASF